MILLPKTVFAMIFVLGLGAFSGVANASIDTFSGDRAAAGGIPYSVVNTVEKRTTQYHIFSEKINMTAHVGEIWQASGDVLYQTNNHDVTDLAKGDDGRHAVKFTKPGEAVIRVYYRKNGEVYVQDFLFTVKERAGSSYETDRSGDNGSMSDGSWPPDSGEVSESPSYNSSPSTADSASASGNVYDENIKNVEAFPEEVLQLVNKERAKVGARPLRLSNDLSGAAAIRAEEITQLFSHTRPDGSQFITLLRDRNHTLGENIAAGNPTPEEVVDSWMHSPGHRANILNKVFKELGVGYYYKEGSPYKHYWVQMFRG